MRRFLFLLCLLTTLKLSAQKPFEIRGVVEGEPPDTIYLFLNGDSKHGDSLKAKITDGAFFFRGKTQLPALVSFHFANKSMIASAYIDAAKTTLSFSASNQFNGHDTIRILKLVDVKGSKTETLHQHFLSEIGKLYKSDLKKEELQIAYYKLLHDFIKNNPFSRVSAYELSKAYLLSFTQVSELANLLHVSLDNTNEVQNVRRLLKELYKPMFTNTPFYFITLNDTADNKISIKNLCKKYTLVVAWASWCVPCRAENPELKKLYEKFMHKGFEIVGVSFDKNSNDWIKAINHDALNWPQLIDKKGIEGSYARHYNIVGIPSNFLVDESGTIVGVDLSPLELENFLKQQFN